MAALIRSCEIWEGLHRCSQPGAPVLAYGREIMACPYHARRAAEIAARTALDGWGACQL